jgi:hypothetical protein
LSIERDRVDRYTVVKWELIKQGLLSEGMLKMIYRWTLGACLFLTLIVTAGCSHIGYDLVNVPPQRHVIGGDMPQEEIFDTGKVKMNYLAASCEVSPPGRKTLRSKLRGIYPARNKLS